MRQLQLVYMTLYLEHCIKYGWTAELEKIGPGDLMSQLIQFMQMFVLDAFEGTAQEGATAEAQSRGKDKNFGGWASQEDSVGQRRRRGPAQEDSDGAPRTEGDRKLAIQTTREILERLKKTQCGKFHRPYFILGIDWSQFIDGEEVTGLKNHIEGQQDLASAKHSMEHTLKSDVFAAAAAGAVGFGGPDPQGNPVSAADSDDEVATE